MSRTRKIRALTRASLSGGFGAEKLALLERTRCDDFKPAVSDAFS